MRARHQIEPHDARWPVEDAGPEYDMVKVPLKVEKASIVPLKATLKRAYSTPGWVSCDFHSHSSPSGDNTADQRGRVLNLLCEHIEFAPCTEHNRLSTYDPHLKRLGAQARMATCVGMELTGAWSGTSAARWRWRESISRSGPGRSSACLARTAPARPRPCA